EIGTMTRSLSSLALPAKINPLDLPHDRKCHEQTFNNLNQRIIKIRQLKTKTQRKEIYELPRLVKLTIRCSYTSDIEDKDSSQKSDLTFTLHTFIELFRT
ncbi:unnamed protein product, partial [Rotaria magnacalcarata]